MSWWLSVHVRRIIAVLLLLFDLGQEPGSALSFTGLEDADGDGVAELCTKEDFWWGAPACVQNQAVAAEEISGSSANANSGPRPASAFLDAADPATPKSLSVPVFAGASLVIAANPQPESPSNVCQSLPIEGVWHRNSYVAQKSDIVLIV